MSRSTLKLAAKAIPGAGEAIMVYDALPEAQEGVSRVKDTYIRTMKEAGGEMRHGRFFKAMKKGAKGAAKMQLEVGKGTTKTALAALAGREEAKARKNRAAPKTGQRAGLMMATFKVYVFEYPGAVIERQYIVGASTHEAALEAALDQWYHDEVRAGSKFPPGDKIGYLSYAEVEGPMEGKPTTKSFHLPRTNPREYEKPPSEMAEITEWSIFPVPGKGWGAGLTIQEPGWREAQQIFKTGFASEREAETWLRKKLSRGSPERMLADAGKSLNELIGVTTMYGRRNPRDSYRGSARDGWYTDMDGSWRGPALPPEGLAFTVLIEDMSGKTKGPRGETIFGLPGARTVEFHRYGRRDSQVLQSDVIPYVRSLRSHGATFFVFDSRGNEVQIGEKNPSRRGTRQETKVWYTVTFRNGVKVDEFEMKKSPRQWLAQAARAGNREWVENFRSMGDGAYTTHITDELGDHYVFQIFPGKMPNQSFANPSRARRNTAGLAPGFSIFEKPHMGKTAFGLALNGRPTEHYAMTPENAAKLSHKIDPRTGKRIPRRWGR